MYGLKRATSFSSELVMTPASGVAGRVRRGEGGYKLGF
jgi:hypothetical protein